MSLHVSHHTSSSYHPHHLNPDEVAVELKCLLLHLGTSLPQSLNDMYLCFCHKFCCLLSIYTSGMAETLQ